MHPPRASRPSCELRFEGSPCGNLERKFQGSRFAAFANELGRQMKITERRVYRGPNLYAHFPCIRLTIDLGALESHPTAKIEGFNGKLVQYEHT